ncbi:MAG: hypothetical protein AAFQ21_01875 [Pseudomonadota bacterium]
MTERTKELDARPCKPASRIEFVRSFGVGITAFVVVVGVFLVIPVVIEPTAPPTASIVTTV